MADNPPNMRTRVRCLELYSGIGGFAVSARSLGWEVVRAIDINQLAASVYRLNFDHQPQIRTIESLPSAVIEEMCPDLWWMSPPCQPYTRRGAGRDAFDARTESFLHALNLLRALAPKMLALENVPEFATSAAADQLRISLDVSGYKWREFELCASDFGMPNRRRRFYLTASRDRKPRLAEMLKTPRHLSEFIGTPRDDLFVERLAEEYAEAIHCVRCDDENPITACFTSAYGNSPVHSGSYLCDDGRLRRFSPREILRLLGFPDSFALPASLSTRQAWKLVGNSLSIPAVVHVLKSLL